MSTTIVPGDAAGTWTLSPITLACAQRMVSKYAWTSAVGHGSTAEVMTELLGTQVPMNRITVRPEAGDAFLCFRLHSRPPEGAILDRTQLEAIGFSWAVLHYIEAGPVEPTDAYRLGSWENFCD